MTAALSPANGHSLRASGRRALRVGPFSNTFEVRTILVTLVLIAAALTLAAVALSLGDYPIPLSEVANVLRGTGSAEAEFIVGVLRLPRAATAAVVGAAFGGSGALFQRLTRNVLASPDMIGITTGASAGAVLMIVVGGASTMPVAFGALAGGLAAAVAVYVLAWRGGITGYRLVLVGIGITFALLSAVHYLLTRANITDAAEAQIWLTGSLNAASWDDALAVCIALAVLVPCALACSRGLRVLQLGDDSARALGVSVNRLRTVTVVAGVGLAATATAAAGPVAFVALASAPVARRLTATAGVALVPAAVMGSCLVLAADIAAQHLLRGLPVGVATALVGAPYLLFLLSRTNRIEVAG